MTAIRCYEGDEVHTTEQDVEITQLKDAVVEAAIAWASDFIVKPQTNPIDDELYFAVDTLIVAREKAEKQQ